MLRYLPIAGFALIGAALLAAQDSGVPQPSAAGEPEVLTRGPIHEAYAASVTQSPQPGALVPKPPPPAIEELPPDQKPDGDNVQWIPGYYSWDDERNDYIWISGFWRQPPPGQQWVPGAWHQTGASWQWTSGFWAPAAQQQMDYAPPPPPVPDIAPAIPAPSDNYTYAPGTWVYRDTRYVWRPGFWYPYRADWMYIPAHYVWTPAGYVFVEGYWDYTLRRRGVIFAPVYIGVAFRPHYVYRPSFVIYDEALYGALFVRPGVSAYYFGDYFDARYHTAGYRGWFEVRIGVGAYDPMWGYYRHAYASTPGWSLNITATFAGRYNGTIARPPRTYVQQNVVVNNITRNRTIVNNTTIVKNVTMVAPINKVDKTMVHLRPVTPVERQAALQSAKNVQMASVQRVKFEQQARAANPGGPTRLVKVALPKTTVANIKPASPPPPPAHEQPRITPPHEQPKASTPPPHEQPKASPPPPHEQHKVSPIPKAPEKKGPPPAEKKGGPQGKDKAGEKKSGDRPSN